MAYTAPSARASHGLPPVYGDSVGVTTAATGPAGGGVVATITPGVAGRWAIQIVAGYGLGVVAAVENANMRLVIDGTNVTTLPVVASQHVMVPCGTFFATLTAAQAVQVQAISAGTGTAVYIAG